MISKTRWIPSFSPGSKNPSPWTWEKKTDRPWTLL